MACGVRCEVFVFDWVECDLVIDAESSSVSRGRNIEAKEMAKIQPAARTTKNNDIRCRC